MIIKNQRPDIKIVNEKRRSKMVSALKSIKSKLKSPKKWKRRACKEKITEDILNDLTFEEGSDCNQNQTSDFPQYLLGYFNEVQQLCFETTCLGCLKGEHSMTMDAMMNYVMLSEISF